MKTHPSARSVMNKLIVRAALAVYLIGNGSAQALDAPVPPGGESSCAALARAFWVDIFEKKKPELSHQYLDETYIQHSEDMPTGVDWVEFWKGAFANPATGPGK